MAHSFSLAGLRTDPKIWYAYGGGGGALVLPASSDHLSLGRGVDSNFERGYRPTRPGPLHPSQPQSVSCVQFRKRTHAGSHNSVSEHCGPDLFFKT